ncbi:NAD(P)H-quinone oxidoreductase [Labrys monachus]|uniref:NADPH2:quinone reductase n=1 Tax=Labrys monachus TaxID=217067 RepID=A0ABU0FG34_9HYPH|nr:NAD(P)H-quinone oxidoreductase [Labrys monachus]MDQ0393568.1 NADPH2:quinone reductase [Labrys monachus]
MSQLPDAMTAIAISRPGGPEVLVPERRPVPRPGESEIVIRVAAAGVNRPDVFQRAGSYPPPKGASDLPGLEVAGEVAAVGAAVTRWRPGDKVCALTPGGGYAEYALVDASNALPVPAGLDMIHAAALPETFFTVWHNLFQRGRLAEGETVLIHGGSSGIGTTAIMLAKAFGATVIVTAGSPEKCDACRKLGADIAIDYKAGDWLPAVKEATQGRGPDVILDMVGGSYIARNYEAAAFDGRIVSIAFLEGSKVEIDFVRLMTKRLTHTGSTLRAQSTAAKAVIARAVEDKVWPLLAAGRCRPLVHATFPLAEAAAAHALMETSSHIGKIVLTV